MGKWATYPTPRLLHFGKSIWEECITLDPIGVVNPNSGEIAQAPPHVHPVGFLEGELNISARIEEKRISFISRNFELKFADLLKESRPFKTQSSSIRTLQIPFYPQNNGRRTDPR